VVTVGRENKTGAPLLAIFEKWAPGQLRAEWASYVFAL
jgi:hypothetical protein